MSKIGVSTGTIAHGQQIPLPAGYTQDECTWFVSANYLYEWYWAKEHTYICSVNASRVVSCYVRLETGETISGTANYMIIGIKQ